MRLVLFDLDGTLLAGSSERRFLGHLVRRGLIGPTQACSGLAFMLRRWPEFGWQTFRKNKAYLAGLEAANVARLGGLFAEQELLPCLRPTMVQRFEHHRRLGDYLALLSGAPDFLVRPLALCLGLRHWRASHYLTEDGRFLAMAPARHLFAGEKLRAAGELCATLGVALGDCTAYANSCHDLALLEVVDQPVAVHPDRRLRHIALRRAWPILPSQPPPRHSPGDGGSFANRSLHQH